MKRFGRDRLTDGHGPFPAAVLLTVLFATFLGGWHGLPGPFPAWGAARPSRVRIVTPAPGTTLDWGEVRKIAWRNPDLGPAASRTEILLSLNGGARWKRLVVLEGNPKSWEWYVHETPGVREDCLLRVVVRDASGKVLARGESASPFTIRGTEKLWNLGAAEGWYFSSLQLGRAAAADLDGDGRQEVALLSFEGESCFTVKVVRRTEDGKLPVVTTLSTFGLLDLREIAAADLNGDGRTDLALSAVSTLGGGMRARLLILYQDPAGGQIGKTSVQKVLASDRIGDLTCGDFNGDGRTDVAVLAEPTFAGGLGAVSLFLQSPTGTIPEERRYTGCAVDLEGEIRSGDLDGDGRTDLVVRSGERDLAVLRQDPAVVGTGFAPPVAVSLGGAGMPPLTAVAVGDLDNDGVDEVAAAAGTAVRILKRGEDGGFSVTRTVTLDSPPVRLAVADQDGDRLLDLLAGWPTHLAVFPQTCGHAFGPPLVKDHCFTAPPDPDLAGSLLQADVDGDGIPDSVISGYHGDLYFVFGEALP
jgi:hypothetical protein